MTTTTINIAKDFSKSPSGRYLSDGAHSGEVFREQFLYPAVSKNDSVIIQLDGTLGYGSSFLEEAFGGLVREKGLEAQLLKQKLRIQSSRAFYIERIWKYISEAGSRKKK